jgi:hypothetical protein
MTVWVVKWGGSQGKGVWVLDSSTEAEERAAEVRGWGCENVTVEEVEPLPKETDD